MEFCLSPAFNYFSYYCVLFAKKEPEVITHGVMRVLNTQTLHSRGKTGKRQTLTCWNNDPVQALLMYVSFEGNTKRPVIRYYSTRTEPMLGQITPLCTAVNRKKWLLFSPCLVFFCPTYSSCWSLKVHRMCLLHYIQLIEATFQRNLKQNLPKPHSHWSAFAYRSPTCCLHGHKE